eukprot:Rmarinus@m.3543
MSCPIPPSRSWLLRRSQRTMTLGQRLPPMTSTTMCATSAKKRVSSCAAMGAQGPFICTALIRRWNSRQRASGCASSVTRKRSGAHDERKGGPCRIALWTLGVCPTAVTTNSIRLGFSASCASDSSKAIAGSSVMNCTSSGAANLTCTTRG